MKPSFWRITSTIVISLATLLPPAVGHSSAPAPTSDGLILSKRETEMIADLIGKKQVRFNDAIGTAYVSPGLWYAVDAKQKKNLTILLARRLAAKNKVEFSSIDIVSSMTGRKLATFTIVGGFRVE